MNNEQLNRLFGSIKNLETTINSVFSRLSEKEDVSQQILDRVASYKKICEMQKRFSSQLETSLNNKQYEEVARLVKLINGLSAMILDDAKLILNGVEFKPHETSVC